MLLALQMAATLLGAAPAAALPVSSGGIAAVAAVAAVLDTTPDDTLAARPEAGPVISQPLVGWRPEALPQPLAVAGPSATADTGRRRRPVAIEYSDFYATRLAIHRYASYTMLPLFVAQYIAGEDLLKNGTNASSFARNWHRPLATSVAVLFGVNTVTGLWNLWDSRHDPAGRTRRTIHSLLMLTADAGFVATGITAQQARNSGSRRSLHQKLAIGSMAISVVGDLMMLIWKD